MREIPEPFARDTDHGKLTEETQTPYGHSISAHAFHGWCACCQGRDVGDEINAWRSVAITYLTRKTNSTDE